MAVLFDNNIVKEPLRDPWFLFPVLHGRTGPVLRVFENTKRFFNSELFFSPQKNTSEPGVINKINTTLAYIKNTLHS
jgi:hypothetical protein